MTSVSKDSIFLIFLILVFIATMPFRAIALNHPGVLHSSADILFIRSKIAEGKEPWKTAFDRLKSSKLSSLSYTATPFSSVDCGSYNNPNNGCNEINDDGAAAYSHALMWVLTRDQRHADKAKSIIKLWASVYHQNTESNSRLVVAWAAPYWVNAAELLRYSNCGWSDADIRQFISMLDKFLPYVKDNESPENNWMQSRIEAHLAIAVFKDDKAEFDAAVDRWKFWLPIYIYQTSDGSAPINPPGRTITQTYNIWKSSATGTSFVNGLAMETCRDLGHLGLGFGSMVYAAEIAWQQGVDLFTPNKKRLSDFMELHGGWMTGSVSVPGSVCGGVVKARQSDTYGISTPNGGGKKVWEIAFNHLNQRLGILLPYTKRMITDGRPTGAGHWVAKWETLTHGDRVFDNPDNEPFNNPPVISIVQPISGSITLNVGDSLYILAEGYDPDNNFLKTTLSVNGVDLRDEFSAPFEWGHPNSPDKGELKNLQPGVYEIVVIATDSLNATASKNVTVTVLDDIVTASMGSFFMARLHESSRTLRQGFYLVLHQYPAHITVVDMKGKIAWSRKGVENGQFITSNTLPRGVYVVRIKTEKSVRKLRMVNCK